MHNENGVRTESPFKTILHGHSIHNGLVTTEELSKLVHLPCEGIELDIRSYRGVPVVAHDLEDAQHGELLATLLPIIAASGKFLLLEFKEYSRDLWDTVVRDILEHHLASRTTLFAFSRIARNFPWQGERCVPMGIIEPFPWRIARVAETLHPEMILMGWGSRWEKFTFYNERSLFKIVWAVTRRFSKSDHLALKIVVGVLRTRQDLTWVTQQQSFFAGICDRSFVEQNIK